MFTAITQRSAPLSSPNGHGREEGFLRNGTDRSRKYTTPASLAPAGRFATLAEAVARFRELRAHTIEFVAACRADLRDIEVPHPIGGLVTGQECLALLAVHGEFVAACRADLRDIEVPHPIGGLVTGQECLALLAIHPARHAAQIREVRQSLGLDEVATHDAPQTQIAAKPKARFD